jgi:hypothetical protein
MNGSGGEGKGSVFGRKRRAEAIPSARTAIPAVTHLTRLFLIGLSLPHPLKGLAFSLRRMDRRVHFRPVEH